MKTPPFQAGFFHYLHGLPRFTELFVTERAVPVLFSGPGSGALSLSAAAAPEKIRRPP